MFISFEILLYSTFKNDKASEHAKDICVKIDNFIEFLPYCHFKEEWCITKRLNQRKYQSVFKFTIMFFSHWNFIQEIWVMITITCCKTDHFKKNLYIVWYIIVKGRSTDILFLFLCKLNGSFNARSFNTIWYATNFYENINTSL